MTYPAGPSCWTPSCLSTLMLRHCTYVSGSTRMIFLDVAWSPNCVAAWIILLFGCQCPLCTSGVRVNAEKLVKTQTEGVVDEGSRSLSMKAVVHAHRTDAMHYKCGGKQKGFLTIFYLAMCSQSKLNDLQLTPAWPLMPLRLGLWRCARSSVDAIWVLFIHN
jgi:hypothetical protein